MYSGDLMVRVPVLFGPGWQSVRLWDFRVGTGVVMLCQVLRPEERGRIRAGLGLDEFPLFLGFWEE